MVPSVLPGDAFEYPEFKSSILETFGSKRRWIPINRARDVNNDRLNRCH